jgi:putative ABC transport system permease protein
MSKLMRRLSYLFTFRRRQLELDQEIEHHRQLHQDALERSGVPPREAVAASRRGLGNVTLAREDARTVWLGSAVERIWRDTRYDIRVLRRQPGFAAAAIVILAVGIGTTTTLYSIVDAEL